MAQLQDPHIEPFSSLAVLLRSPPSGHVLAAAAAAGVALPGDRADATLQRTFQGSVMEVWGEERPVGFSKVECAGGRLEHPSTPCTSPELLLLSEITAVEVEDEVPPSAGGNGGGARAGKPLPIGQRLLPTICIESEIGQADKHVLKNVTRVERFIQDVIRKTVEEELVFPNFQTFVLGDQESEGQS